MTNTEETIMSTKDIFEVGYWIVSLIILGINCFIDKNKSNKGG